MFGLQGGGGDAAAGCSKSCRRTGQGAHTLSCCCSQALPRVVEILGKEKGWSGSRQREELHRALHWLKGFDGPNWEEEHSKFHPKKAVI